MTCLRSTLSRLHLQILIGVALTGCSCLLFSNDLVNQPNGLDLESRIEGVFSKYHASVVRVKATREITADGKSKRLLKMGSGFFISQDGHILTTGLLHQPDRIWVEYKKSFYLAKNIGNDSLCNLSLLKITSKPKDFSHVSLNDSFDTKKQGSFMVALTCALEFDVGPTYGLFQSEEFSFGKKLFPTKMIRGSLDLGPGEVGAPVFDLNGRFLGICHAALPDLRSSFVLPAKACQRIRDDLLFSGAVNYGWFGIATTKKLNRNNGFDIVIERILEGSSASKSNFKMGDVIVKIDDSPVTHQGVLANAAFFARPGNILDFLVRRDDKEIKVSLKVEKRPLNQTTGTQPDNNTSTTDINSSLLIEKIDN